MAGAPGMSQAEGQLCEFWHVRPRLSTLPAGLAELTPAMLPGDHPAWAPAAGPDPPQLLRRRAETSHQAGLPGLVSCQVGPRAQRTRLGLEKAAAEPHPGPPPRVNRGRSPCCPRPLQRPRCVLLRSPTAHGPSATLASLRPALCPHWAHPQLQPTLRNQGGGGQISHEGGLAKSCKEPDE